MGRWSGLLHQRSTFSGVFRGLAHAVEDRSSKRSIDRQRHAPCVAGANYPDRHAHPGRSGDVGGGRRGPVRDHRSREPNREPAATHSYGYRETRMGVFGRNYQIRKELIQTYHETGEKPFEYTRPLQTTAARVYPKEASIELTAFPAFQFFTGGGTCVGGGGSGAGRINSSWQFVAELSGCLVLHMPASNQSADSLFYGGGLRWMPKASRRFSPYVQLMIGGNRVTHETDDIALRQKLLTEWNDGNGILQHYPLRNDWSAEISKNGPALKLAGGFDLVLARPFAWRLLDLEYAHVWMGNVVNIHPQNALRISTGAVLRIGTW